jgi:uncharacterized Ntn-hydrolase superfamily protein
MHSRLKPAAAAASDSGVVATQVGEAVREGLKCGAKLVGGHGVHGAVAKALEEVGKLYRSLRQARLIQTRLDAAIFRTESATYLTWSSVIAG